MTRKQKKFFAALTLCGLMGGAMGFVLWLSKPAFLIMLVGIVIAVTVADLMGEDQDD